MKIVLVSNLPGRGGIVDRASGMERILGSGLLFL